MPTIIVMTCDHQHQFSGPTLSFPDILRNVEGAGGRRRRPTRWMAGRPKALSTSRGPQLRNLRSNLASSDATLLIDLGNESHLPCVDVPHNDDFVIAFTKLDESLPRTDWCFFCEAIIAIVAGVRDVNFSHQLSLRATAFGSASPTSERPTLSGRALDITNPRNLKGVGHAPIKAGDL
jgi:hypothetical protein